MDKILYVWLAVSATEDKNSRNVINKAVNVRWILRIMTNITREVTSPQRARGDNNAQKSKVTRHHTN